MVNGKSVPVTCLAGFRRVEEVARRKRSRQLSPWGAEEPATTPARPICVCASVSYVRTKALSSGNVVALLLLKLHLLLLVVVGVGGGFGGGVGGGIGVGHHLLLWWWSFVFGE